MIVCALLEILGALLQGLYTVLPTWSFDLVTGTGSAGANYSVLDVGEITVSDQSPIVATFRFLAQLDNYLPVKQFFLAVGFFGTVIVAALAFRTVRFIINVVRGSGA